MNPMARIGLGTVQFGMSYGVSNARGRPSEPEIEAIIARASAAGVGFLDTAASYGDADTLVGRYLPIGHRMRIVTKTPALAQDEIDVSHRQAVIDAVDRSRHSLGVKQLFGVLLHHAADLRKPGAHHLVAALCDVQQRGWVERIGVSVYDAEDLVAVEQQFRPDIVQLPFNVLDRRLQQSGWLDRLKNMNTQIHARSVFLQGLLLMEPAALPEFFAPIRSKLLCLRQQWAGHGLDPLAGCLAFVLTQPAIDAVIVGVNGLDELDALQKVVAGLDEAPRDKENSLIGEIDPTFVDPRRWPRFN